MGSLDPFTCPRMQNKTILAIKRKYIKIEKSEVTGKQIIS
jgi:septum formation topological specificity factor MinE